MTITSIKELKTRSSSITKEGTSYTRVFQIETNDPDDGPKEVRNSLGLSVGGGYGNGAETEADLSSIIDNISVRCTAEDGMSWEATVSYKPWQDAENSNTTSDPLQDDTTYSWDWVQHEKPVDVDANGEPIVNSAGRPFSEPQSKDDSRPTLTISRNEASFITLLAIQYRDAVNSDSFFGAEPGMAKFSSIGGNRQYNAEIGYYWRVTYEIQFNADKWNPIRLQDAGYVTRSGYFDGGSASASVTTKPITINGKPPSEPQLLDGAGGLLAPGEEPVYLEFEFYKTLPFGVFGLEV